MKGYLMKSGSRDIIIVGSKVSNKVITGFVCFEDEEPIYDAVVTVGYETTRTDSSSIEYTIGYAKTDINGEFNFLLNIENDIADEYILKAYLPLKNL